jgi:hypothetical protein
MQNLKNRDVILLSLVTLVWVQLFIQWGNMSLLAGVIYAIGSSFIGGFWFNASVQFSKNDLDLNL